MSRARFVSLIPLVAALACGGGDPPPERDASSERALSSGAVVGYAHPDHEAHAWKGIPFARPPIGPLRWRAPRPPEAWDGTREVLV
jgi:para-nitrobenzyl esterase